MAKLGLYNYSVRVRMFNASFNSISYHILFLIKLPTDLRKHCLLNSVNKCIFIKYFIVGSHEKKV